MSNRKKSLEERKGQASYRRKSRWRRPMFRFDVLQDGQKQPQEGRDRSLRGKARVKARRAAQRAENES